MLKIRKVEIILNYFPLFILKLVYTSLKNLMFKRKIEKKKKKIPDDRKTRFLSTTAKRSSRPTSYRHRTVVLSG